MITTASQRKEIVRRVLELNGHSLRWVIDSMKADAGWGVPTDAIVREVMRELKPKRDKSRV